MPSVYNIYFTEKYTVKHWKYSCICNCCTPRVNCYEPINCCTAQFQAR